jgi:hypothetical protein
MSQPQELHIHTVYSAEAETAVAAPSLRLRGLAVLTLLVGVVWLYATWSVGWKWTKVGVFVLVTMDDHAAAQQQTAAEDAVLRPPILPRPDANTDVQAAARAAHARLSRITNVWLGMIAFVGLWLTMSGFAGLPAGGALRRIGRVLAPLVVVALGMLIWHVQHEYAWLESIMPRWVPPVLIVLMFALAASAGFALQRRRVSLLRLAGLLVILSACGTITALWAALRWGGIPMEGVDSAMYVKVFLAQSAYGWLLLIGAIGLRNRQSQRT